MNYRRAKTVYVKELVDILRDRRTLIAMILVPIILYPLIMLGGVQAISAPSTDIEGEKMVIGVQQDADWDYVIYPFILQERRMLKRMRADALARGASEDELAEIPTPLSESLGEHQVSAQLDHDVAGGVVVQHRGAAGASPVGGERGAHRFAGAAGSLGFFRRRHEYQTTA